MLVRARDVEGTVGAKFMLTRSAEAFAIDSHDVSDLTLEAIEESCAFGED